MRWKFPPKLIVFVSLFGYCCSSCPSKSTHKTQEAELPLIQLWTDPNDRYSVLKDPGDTINDLNQVAPLLPSNTLDAVQVQGAVITCSASYPVLLVASDGDEDGDDLFWSAEEFLVTSTSLHNVSFNLFSTAFETRTSFQLSTVQNTTLFACEAVHDPCLRSRGYLEFTRKGHSIQVDFHQRPSHNFVVRVAENLDPELNFSTLNTLAANISTKSKSDRTRLQPKTEPDCDAIFYYQLVESRLSDIEPANFHMTYRCQFSDGSPGVMDFDECKDRGRCNLPQQRNQTVKNCWRRLTQEACFNCTTVKVKSSSLMDLAIPICVQSLEEAETETQGRLVKGTPLYFGFPSSFNISRPDIRTWDTDEGNERMIQMHVFEEVHLINSLLKITCEASSRYTAKPFFYAFKFQDKPELEFFKKDGLDGAGSPIRMAKVTTGHVNTQTIQVHLDQTNLERIFCFAPIQNSRHWINASRPVRVVPHVQDLFKPMSSQCKNGRILDSNPNPNPTLVVERKDPSKNPQIVPETENVHEEPFDDSKFSISCQANYPIQLIHNSVQRSANKFSTDNGLIEGQDYHFHGRDAKYENEVVVQFPNNTNTNTSIWTYDFVIDGFDLKKKNSEHFFRCESIENPCLHRSFQFYWAGELKIRFFPFPQGNENQTIKTELGRPSNYSECEVIFLYKKLDGYPGFEFEFGCEFPLEQRGTVKFHPCDSINECKNTYRNKRQPRNCWRELKSEETCGPDCKRSEDGFKPFVASCSIDRTIFDAEWDEEEIQHQESTLGSFAAFGLSKNKDEIPSIYFSEDEVDPENMTFLESFDKYQFPGNVLTVTCKVSAFYKNLEYLDIHFAKYFADRNELIFIKPENYEIIDQSFNEERYFWTRTVSFELGEDEKLSRIYCIGHHGEGSNSSREIHLHAAKSPEISIRIQDGDQEREPPKNGEVSLEHSSTNVLLVCQVYGYPPPEILWEKNGVKVDSSWNATSVTQTTSQVLLPIVDVGVEGNYSCTAKNEQGETSSIFKIGINHPVDKSFVGISAFASFIFFIFVLFVLFFWRRISQKPIRDLSDDEVHLFCHGDNTIDPTDSNAAIFALGYDKNLEVSPEFFKIDEISLALGAGEFGIVRRGFLKSKDSEVELKSQIPLEIAVKMPKFNVSPENFISFLNEIKTISHVQSHENILKILGASTINIKQRRALMLLEYCELGNLKNFLNDKKHLFKSDVRRSSLPECEQVNLAPPRRGYVPVLMPECEQVNLFPPRRGYVKVSMTETFTHEILEILDLLNFSLGIANGMNFLAEKKVIHGDLAARNVLLTHNREVKICDFGFSTKLKDYEKYAKTNQCVIPWRWFPLEALLNHKFSLKSDCWSYGMLLYEIFSLGEDPHPGFDKYDSKFVQYLRDGEQMQKPDYADEEMYDLMKDCWHLNPVERPTFADISKKISDMRIELIGPK